MCSVVHVRLNSSVTAPCLLVVQLWRLLGLQCLSLSLLQGVMVAVLSLLQGVMISLLLSLLQGAVFSLLLDNHHIFNLNFGLSNFILSLLKLKLSNC